MKRLKQRNQLKHKGETQPAYFHEVEWAVRAAVGTRASQPTVKLAVAAGGHVEAFDADTGRQLEGGHGAVEVPELQGGHKLHTHLVLGYSTDDKIHRVHDAAHLIAVASGLDPAGVLDSMMDDITSAKVTFFGMSNSREWIRGIAQAKAVRVGDDMFLGQYGDARNEDGSWTLQDTDFEWRLMGVTVRDVLSLWSRRGVDISGYADSLGVKMMKMPEGLGSIESRLKRGKLIDGLRRFWPNIESDLKNANRNGLKQCQHGTVWDVAACIDWARSNARWHEDRPARGGSDTGRGWAAPKKARDVFDV